MTSWTRSSRQSRTPADAIASKAKRARLEALDREAAALDKRDDALTVSDDEAKRLRGAAERAKAARKT
jgi:hypothetical protein